MVEEQDLIYIDKNIKKEMEEFESIKILTAEVIKCYAGQGAPIKNWKQQIRKTLIRVREKFIDWVESFINKFVDSLKNIEKSKEMKDFIGEDQRI